MHIFVDESGIHKPTDHSVFVLVYVEIENCDLMEEKVREVEKKLFLEEGFHWSETVWKVKQKFLELILSLDFQVKIAIIKNPIHPAKELERVLTHMLVERDIHTVSIDGKKSKWYERRMKYILHTKGIAVKKLKTVKAKQSAGIRVADAIAGLARSYFDEKGKEKILAYYKRLEKKVIVIIS